MKARFQSRIGFSLIEMLTVMAFIAILMALGIRGWSTALERGRRATCLSNCRQFSIAGNMLIMASGNYLPYRSGPLKWGEAFDQLIPYLGGTNYSLANCPSNRDPKQDSDSLIPSSGGKFYTEYEFNGYICSTPGNNRHVSGIDDPSQVAYSYDYPHSDSAGDQLASYRAGCKRHHGNGINVAYLDGHASWLPVEEFGGIGNQTIFYRKGHNYD